MATSPTDHLKEIQDSLKNLPERLALVLNRKGTESGQRDSKGRFLNKEGTNASEEGLPDKWRSSERFLSAGGNFAPGLSKISTFMRNLRELGDASAQLHKAFSGQPAHVMPKPTNPSPATVPSISIEDLQLMQRVQPDMSKAAGATQKTFSPGFTPPVADRSRQGAPRTVFPNGLDFEGVMRELRDALERNTEALERNDPDPTENSEEKQTAKPAEEPRETTRKAQSQGEPESPRAEARRIKGPLRPPKHVPSAKDAGAGAGEASEAAEVAELLV